MRIKTYYTVYGFEFEPNDFTNHISITPSKTWLKGEKRSISNLEYSDSGWSIIIEALNTHNISKEIIRILEIIEPKAKKIKSYINKFKLESEIACEILGEENESPELHIDEKILSRICKLQCSLDIDIL